MTEWRQLPFDGESAPGVRPISVSELTAQLKGIVEGAFASVIVLGEISNCRPWSSGHLYFTLKDDYAQLRAVMFRTRVRRLRFRPEDGLRVIARGRVSVYEVKGDYQIVCDTLEPQGLGALQAAFEQLKRKLQAEGLFAVERKRPLPVLPRRIGVITSADGAAVRDILRVLTTRHPSARLVLRPARVQGEGAAADLVRALAAVARVPDVDVIIIGRGGGSTEDLWAFNDEALARAIGSCPVPVISAVGHESDFTIADFVADLRAATPSNAAELVVDRADNFRARIERARQRLQAAIARTADRLGMRVERLDGGLGRWPVAVVMRERDCRELGERLTRAATAVVGRLDERVDALGRRLDRRDVRRTAAALTTRMVSADLRLRQLVRARRVEAESRARGLAGRLHALSPLAVLARGYAVCWDEARTGIIRSARAVRPGDGVRVTLADGELGCHVDTTE
jgi:exodeoxyribonuclease VII large subunit